MELDELRQMSAEDLRVKEREAREEIFRLRLKLRTNQLDNPSGYRRARKELARIKTVLKQKIGGAGDRRRRQGQRCGSELSGAKAWWLPPDDQDRGGAGRPAGPASACMANGSSGARASWRMTKKRECHEGDRVMIIESRPLSKNKRWRVSQISRRRQR